MTSGILLKFYSGSTRAGLRSTGETVAQIKMEITNNNPEKIKDPRRVEAGKRLAAISKAAKAKKRERLQTIQEANSVCNETNDGSNEESTALGLGQVIGVIGAITGVGALYFAYKQYERNKPDKSNEPDPKPEPPRDTRVSSKTLDTLD